MVMGKLEDSIMVRPGRGGLGRRRCEHGVMAVCAYDSMGVSRRCDDDVHQCSKPIFRDNVRGCRC